MKRYLWSKYLLAIPLLLAGLYGVAVILEVQEPKWLMAQTKVEEGQVFQGRVESLLQNDHEDVDGLRLSTGDEVHFPPHIGRQVADLIKAGDEVDIQATKKTRPLGKVVFEATQIVSHGKTIKIDRPTPKHHPKGKRKHEAPMNAAGKVQEFTTNAHGDVDGLLLDDQTVVKFPPQLGEELQVLLKTGTAVQIEGRRHETPHGDIHLHADHIVDVASGKAIDRDTPKH